jgi:hypothetical protein
MAENRLGVSSISFPSTIDKDLKIALEQLVAMTSDTTNYLMKPQIKSVTSNTQLTDLDSVVLVNANSGAKTITLPDAGTVEGKQLKIKKTDASANAVTVVGTIDGAVNYTLDAQNDYVCVVSDGNHYFVVSNN